VEKANSYVTVSYDPSFFEWYNGKGEKYTWGKRSMTVRITEKGIYLSVRSAEKIKEVVEERPDGGYTVQIGVAKKAVAFKPVPPGAQGYRFGPTRWGLFCSCARFASRLAEQLELPVTLQAVWDEQNKMLVAKFPGADERPPVRRGRVSR